MGIRGPGAERLREAREKLATLPKRRFPWQKKGISRPDAMKAIIQWLPCTVGKKRGKKIKLEPFQLEWIDNTFATDKRGKPKTTLSILSGPKGCGKTTLTACVCIAYLLCEPFAEERGEIFAASISKDKTNRLFKEIKAILYRVPEFAGRVNIQDSAQRITVISGEGLDSTFECLTATEGSGAGLLASLWVYDECGEAADNGRLLNELMNGDGKRGDEGSTLGICLSTQAGTDDHPYSKLIDDVLSGAEPSHYIKLLTAPKDADPFSDETLRMVNPSAGKFLDFKALQKAAAFAKRNPGSEPAFRRYRLNQRVEAKEELRLVTADAWKACGKPVRENLKGKRCYGGIDLSASARGDLTAFTLVFPDDAKPECNFDVLTWCWTPLAGLQDRRHVERDNFNLWMESGHLRGIEGKIIRLPVVAADLKKIAKDYDIQCIGYDSWHIEMLIRDLEDIGVTLPMEKFSQGQTKAMAPAIDFLQEAILTERIRHGNNPVLTASMTNAIIVPDRAGNPMIDKPRSSRRGPVRVDPTISLVMALGMARTHQDTKTINVGSFLSDPIMVI